MTTATRIIRNITAALLAGLLVAACASGPASAAAPADRPRPSALGNDKAFHAIWDAVYGTDDAQAAALLFLAAPVNGGDLNYASQVARLAYDPRPVCRTAVLYEAGWLVVELHRNGREAVKAATWGKLLIGAAGSATPMPTMASSVTKAIMASSKLTGAARTAAERSLRAGLSRLDRTPTPTDVRQAVLAAAINTGKAMHWRGAATNRLGALRIACGA